MASQARELRQKGIEAAKAGRKDEARQLLQQAIRLEPQNEAAWLWLASVARDARERAFCLQQILEINPHNETAKRALEGLMSTLPPETEAPQSIGLKKLPGAPKFRTTADLMTQSPGVPLPSTEDIATAQKRAESIISLATQPPSSDIKYVHKTKRRAGEGDIVRLRLTIMAAVGGLFALLIIAGVVLVATNDDVRGIVFGPTATFTFTPTVTPTNTPGFTPTPSTQPRVSPTPTDAAPVFLTRYNPYAAPTPTTIYPAVFEVPQQNAISAINSGLFAVALPTLHAEELLIANNFNPNPYYWQAIAYLGEEDVDSALDILEVAEGRLDEAPNQNYDALINSGFAQVYWQIAQNELAEGNTAGANLAYEQLVERAEAAIQRDARLEAPYIYLARSLAAQRNYDEAIQILDRGLAVPSLESNTNLITEKGHVYLFQREYDLARYQAFLALYVDATSQEAHQLRITAAMQANQPGQAVLDAETYLYYYPGSTYAFKLLGDAHAEEGNNDLALRAYSQGLQGATTADGYVETLISRGTLYLNAGNYNAALDDFTRAYDLEETYAIQALRLQAAFGAGRYQTALSDIDDLLGRNALSDDELRMIQAQINYELMVQADTLNAANLNPIISALETVNANGNLTPNQRARINLTLAQANLALGNRDAALNQVNIYLANEDSLMGHYVRGQIYEAMNDRTEAQREYEWVLLWSQVYPFSERADVEAKLLDLIN